MIKKYFPFIEGRFDETPSQTLLPLKSPFDGETLAEVGQATPAQVEKAIAAASAAYTVYRKFSRYTRARLVSEIAKGISSRRHDFVERIINEAGKPYILADAEVSRAINTFQLAGEEARQSSGSVVPLDLDAAGRAYGSAVAELVPRGPVLAINPFNFPLNLVAHKVAPALAVGTSVILKPPPQAPGVSTLLAEVFLEAARLVRDERESVPLAVLQVINASNEVMEKAVTDSRIATLSFTGSDKVGWMLQQKAIKKRVLLELGGNAAVIVHEDADLKRAANRCAFGAFAYAGQVCISVQRIFVHSRVYPQFKELFLDEVRKLKVGDPKQKDVLVGPLIDSNNADRILDWIAEAKKGNAEVLIGGDRKGNIVAPTVLTKVPPTCRLETEEAFGPVVSLDSYETFEEALMKVNRSKFGLQAGVFTNRGDLQRSASENLDVGGVLINEAPIYRADNMPYGGMKESGLGREGLRYAMADYCDWRTTITWKG